MESSRDYLKKKILEEVFIEKKNETIFSPSGEQSAWLFDFRRVLLQADTLHHLGEVFFETFKTVGRFQIGGLEVAAIPLVTGLVLTYREKGGSVNGFFIRKSRKKEGLLRMIEGTTTNEPIIFVDDIINSGKSFIRQVEVAEALGLKVHAVFSILRYRDESYYEYFQKKNIQVVSLFTLNDFMNELGVQNFIDKKELPVPMPFEVKWRFTSPDPNFFYVVPKSAPVLDEERVFFGSDKGVFWAINQADGSVSWKYQIGFGSKQKYIFSSPIIFEKSVYFGGYDGNFYALNRETGKREWVFMEADWIGSSPCIADSLGLIFIGLEFGLFNKHGGVVALDARTGKKKWQHTMPGLVHSSPKYSETFNMVIIGCNDFVVRAFDAKKGTLLWEHPTLGEVKESFAFDDSTGTVSFGSFDSHIHILNARTGELMHKIKTREGIYSTPLSLHGKLFATSLDKRIYGIDIVSGTILWEFLTSGRIFASPKIVEGRILIGSNDGRLYELDPNTGKNTAYIQVTERITNAVAYNNDSKRIFLPTFANEIYCLERRKNVIL